MWIPLLVAVTLVGFPPSVDVEMASSAREPHDPIEIRRDTDFLLPTSGVRSGSGTATDPFLIEGWDIDATTPPGPLRTGGFGILVRDTTKHYVIRDCRVWNGGDLGAGIHLSHASNGTLEDVEVFGNQYGLAIVQSRDMVLRRINATENLRFGVQLSGVVRFQADDVIADASLEGSGFVVYETGPGKVRGLQASGNGRDFELGRGVYVRASHDLSIEGVSALGNVNAGLAVVGSQRVKLSNVTVDGGGEAGIHLAQAKWVDVANASVARNEAHGVLVAQSLWITLDRIASSSNALHGIYLNSTHASRITNGSVEDNGGQGIVVRGDENLVEGNWVARNRASTSGALAVRGQANVVRENRVSTNAGAGIEASGAGNLVTANHLWMNEGGPFRTDGATLDDNRFRAGPLRDSLLPAVLGFLGALAVVRRRVRT